MSASPRDRIFWPALLAIAACAWLAALASRFGHSLSVDEPFTANALALPFPQLWETWKHDNTPVTYLVLRAWRLLFGDSALALRAATSSAFAAAVVLTGVAGRRLRGPLTGLLAAVLVGTSGRVGLEHAATIRPYALLTLESAAVALCLMHLAGRDDGRRSWHPAAGLALVHVAGLFTHPVYAFVIASSCIAGGLARLLRPTLVAATVGVAIYRALWWPMFHSTLALPATNWMAAPRPLDLWDTYLGLWGNRNGFVLVGAIAAIAALAGRKAAALSRDPRVRLCALIAVLTLVVPFGVSFAKPVFHVTRTPTIALPFIALTLATLLTELGAASLSLFIAALLAVGAIQHVAGSQRVGDISPTGSSLAAVLGDAHCGDTLIAGGLSFASIDYYRRQLRAPDCITLESYPADVTTHPGWLDEAAIVAAESGYRGEAGATATRLASAGHGRVFAFVKTRGIGATASAWLADALGHTLTVEETLPLKGGFFDEVRVYVPMSPPAQPNPDPH